MSTSSPPVAPWRAGIQGARANLVPGLVLQAFALALVLGYYFVPDITDALTRWSVWRDRMGVGYSMASTALFGAVIPWIYLRFIPATRHRYNATQGLGLTLFWAYKGLEMHWLYTGLAHFVGHDNSVSTIATKVMLDQFVYAPLLAAPGMWLGYQWVETHFDLRQVWTQFRTRGWFYQKLLPIMIANIGIWLPTVAIIYALPLPLQLPLENLVLCFFTLMLAHLSRHQNNV